jgi:outer membrane protein
MYFNILGGNYMKVLALALLVLTTMCGVGFAQTSFKMGYIDLQKVIRDSKAGKSAKAAFENEFKKKKQIIDNKANILAQEKQSFVSQSPLMDDEARKRKAEEIQQNEKELTRLRDDFRDELQKKDFELTQKILKELESVIKNIGIKEGYSLIVEKTESGIIFGGDNVNITQKVITAYDSSR